MKIWQLNLIKAFKSDVYRHAICTIKVASSLDGRTAMASGESKWITGSAARQDVQHWRAISGAVITGIETVIADDCQQCTFTS